MNYKKIIKFLFLIIILCLLMYIMQNTYSKYIEEKNDNSNYNISRWNIKINDQDITNNQNLMKLISLEDIPNDNIMDGVIAPTYKAKFSINIDSTGTDVPYKYKIELADGTSTQSTYEMNMTGTNGSGMYYFTLSLQTQDYDYNLSSWENRDIQPELKIYVGKDFNLATSQINWWADPAHTYYDGEYLITHTLFYVWSYDEATHTNTFTSNCNLSYNHQLDLGTEKIIGTLYLDGKSFNNVKVPDFRITSYLKGEDVVDIPTDEYFVEGIVEPKENDETVNNDYTFFLEWYDGPDEMMSNEDDVAVTKPDEATGVSSTSIPLKVTVTQITDEELANYKAANP